MGVKSLIRWPLSLAGLDLVRLDRQPRPPQDPATWTNRMAHARSLGFDPQVILDGGAFDGTWATSAARIFPGSKLILVEPNPHLQAKLGSVAAAIQPTPILVEAALASEPGTASLNVWREVDNDAGASLLPHVQGRPAVEVAVSVDTIDNITARHHLSPDLVKLDLQGAELQALLGARATLRTTEMLIVEFGCIDAYMNRTSPQDVMDVAYSAGFVLYDVFDIRYRPLDGALGGGDFCFVKRHGRLRASRSWN